MNQRNQPILKALQTIRIVQDFRANRVSQGDALIRLADSGAPARLLFLLNKLSQRVPAPAPTGNDDAVFQIQSQDYLSIAASFLDSSDLLSFHQLVQASAAPGSTYLPAVEDYGDTANREQRSRLFEILQIQNRIDHEEGNIQACLAVADDRFTRNLYRSAGVAYGIVHLLFPFANPWTLWNWKRSIEHTHPSIHIQTKFIVHPS